MICNSARALSMQRRRTQAVLVAAQHQRRALDTAQRRLASEAALQGPRLGHEHRCALAQAHGEDLIQQLAPVAVTGGDIVRFQLIAQHAR